MGGIREKGPVFPERPVSIKIAAPKPIRARPQALTHMANSKWLETSPIKSDNPIMNSNLETSKQSSEDNRDATKSHEFILGRKIHF